MATTEELLVYLIVLQALTLGVLIVDCGLRGAKR